MKRDKNSKTNYIQIEDFWYKFNHFFVTISSIFSKKTLEFWCGDREEPIRFFDYINQNLYHESFDQSYSRFESSLVLEKRKRTIQFDLSI